ncbi:MAG: DUF4395 family protein [bacterium]
MEKHKPVEISSGSFAFCRYFSALLLWLALLLKNQYILYFLIFAFIWAVIFRVKYSPFVLFYRYTIDLIFKSHKILVDEYDILFMHQLTLGIIIFGTFNIIFVNAIFGWIIISLFALLKTISALGYCPAAKLRRCITSRGACCNLNPTNQNK